MAPPLREPRHQSFGGRLSAESATRPISVVSSSSARTRLEAAHRFIHSFPPATELLLVGETRDAVDDLVRESTARGRASFGLHRLSIRQLAANLAALELARGGLAIASTLGAEAVAARAAFEALADNALDYLAPVARLRSIGQTLSETIRDLRDAAVDIGQLDRHGPRGRDLRVLAERYDEQLSQAGLVDTASLLRLAAASVPDSASLPVAGPVLLLDVAIRDEATTALVRSVLAHASAGLATVPEGDDWTLQTLRGLPGVTDASADDEADTEDGPLGRVRSFLFSTESPPEVTDEPDDGSAVTMYSAPGEGRECVEIARVALREAKRGVAFDRMAVLVRSPEVYAGLLETALDRAGIPGWFARGTRAPDPAGRAFLALLACAADGLSARRFAEYLSLAQVPPLSAEGAPPTAPAGWVPPDTALTDLPAPAQLSLFDVAQLDETDSDTAGTTVVVGDDEPVLAGSLRAPLHWDRLLVESAVIGGRDRWARRLDGLARELRLRRDERASEEPESPRVRALDRDLRNLDHLRRFALPVVERLADLPLRATWGEWLDALESLVPMVLTRPDRVLAVLGELRPMARVGPVPLAEVRDVLSRRLATLQEDPPSRRYGRIYVGSPEQIRGRQFDVVFVPGLAERIFPQKQRQDPLLLDDIREVLRARPSGAIPPGLPTQDDRAADERLLLRLAVGAATTRLYLSYPRLQLSESRPRVPSFYALDVERARRGRVPDFITLESAAYLKAKARLAWPAPDSPTDAVDDTEHDLATLGPLLKQTVTPDLKGRARYLLTLNPGLRRSLLTRWARWKRPWSRYDGLYGLDPSTQQLLDAHRVDARPFSVSALQRFAACPYQFLLSTIYRLEPRDEIEPLERMDPLTRGRLFHEVQAELVRALQGQDALPVTTATVAGAEQVLDATLDRVAAAYHDDLAPAIERVWADEVESMRADLKGWLLSVAEEEGDWIPIRSEFGFGFRAGHGRDPDSVPDPVLLDGRWKLHGVVDLIEAKTGPTADGALRVTDHKTGKNRTRDGLVVGHGEVLQPLLYGLAVEQALSRPVATSRLFYCTVNGRFDTRPVALGEAERRMGIEVLEIVDRAVGAGELLPAPRRGACDWCDFRDVCGPWEERRVAWKDESKLADLEALRRLP